VGRDRAREAEDDRRCGFVDRGGEADAHHATLPGSLLDWTARDGASVRVSYGPLIDEPALEPTAHTFVGSEAPSHEILDDLSPHDEYPWP